MKVSSSSFVDRTEELAALQRHLESVRAHGTGRMLAVRGRRQVGKSRLVEEFLERASLPSVYFQATGLPRAEELARFVAEIGASSLPAAETARGGGLGSWSAALNLLAETASPQAPSVVVLDELPYLVESEPGFEAVLQEVWDRRMESRPVLLILIGSDLRMMEALAGYGRPLFGKPRELVVPPLSPRAIAGLLGVAAAAALDAYLVIGGLPRLAVAWTEGRSFWEHLEEALSDAMSPLLVAGERMLSAEFPVGVPARGVLGAIGAGETTFSAIGVRAGLAASSLSRALKVLVDDKRVVAVDEPLSARRSREPRYRVADPYLRFWLRQLRPCLELVNRGRSDLALQRIRRDWPSYRGRAIEPVVREALGRLLPDPRFGDADAVGGYWTRANTVEVDLVGTPEERHTVSFVGTVKWREHAPVDDSDVRSLVRSAQVIPGMHSGTRHVAVSRAGVACGGLDVVLGPDDLLAAWPA